MTVSLSWMKSSTIKSSTSDNRIDAKHDRGCLQLKFFYKTGDSRQTAADRGCSWLKQKWKGLVRCLFVPIVATQHALPKPLICPCKKFGQGAHEKGRGRPSCLITGHQSCLWQPKDKCLWPLWSPVRWVGIGMRRRRGVGCQVCCALQPSPILRRESRMDVAAGNCNQHSCYMQPGHQGWLLQQTNITKCKHQHESQRHCWKCPSMYKAGCWRVISQTGRILLLRTKENLRLQPDFTRKASTSQAVGCQPVLGPSVCQAAHRHGGGRCGKNCFQLTEAQLPETGHSSLSQLSTDLLPGDRAASGLGPTFAQQGQQLHGELCQLVKLAVISGCQCQAWEEIS